MQINEHALPDARLNHKTEAWEHSNVLIIGGGLTSVQLADVLIRRGVSKVHLLMRRGWQLKPFDVDLIWMSKFKSTARAASRSADSFEENLDIIKQARDGGSTTSRYQKILEGHIKRKRLVVHTHITVKTQSYCRDTKHRIIGSQPPLLALPEFDPSS
ncbi:uncharacterized protein LTR77_001926 [Saxophila tyrrhenica]|uniref:L-ornithine N(5)-oxygenase n=1 Tax=Saxophila tyrrhenica TaxID=1690608 RepID=A0AAV9PK93_9PEZI|nr:hypothetical protein LTR77_001926 [Saxophila tyrrhenica]